MEKPLGCSLGHGHHERQVAVRHHAHQHHKLLWLPCLAVCKIERITGKVYLHLSAWLVVVMVRVVVRLAVLSDMQLELGVAIAVGTQLLVECLVNKLHCGMFAFETFQHFGHKTLQFCLAWIL